MMTSASRGRGGVINPATFSKAFDEWRYFHFEVEQLAGLPGFDCPCCKVSQHSVHTCRQK
jgi:hypothetical protein